MGLELSTGWSVALGFTALFSLAVFANATFKDLDAEIERQDDLLATCVLDLNTTSRKLSAAVRERDFAIAKFTEAAELVSKTAGESTDKSFQILRHKDMIAALSAEVAQLKASRLKLEAIVLPEKSRHARRKRPAYKAGPAPPVDLLDLGVSRIPAFMTRVNPAIFEAVQPP